MARNASTTPATASARKAAPWILMCRNEICEDNGHESLVAEVFTERADWRKNARFIVSARNAALDANSENPQAAVEALPELLEACCFTLGLLDHLSAHDYARGGDKEARLRLAAAIEKATARRPPHSLTR